jgi:hypothetical protein
VQPVLSWSLRRWLVLALSASMLIAVALTACGTDFASRQPVAAAIDTPVPVATVYREIPVTPLPSATPLPTVVGPDGAAQRVFPSEIDAGRTGHGLPEEAVISYWTNYLNGARLIVESRDIDLNLCTDGTLLPQSPLSAIGGGVWGLRTTNGEWYEVMLGREFSRGRLTGIVTLSRIGDSTVALGERPVVVSVTDSKLCVDVLGG